MPEVDFRESMISIKVTRYLSFRVMPITQYRLDSGKFLWFEHTLNSRNPNTPPYLIVRSIYIYIYIYQ